MVEFLRLWLNNFGLSAALLDSNRWIEPVVRVGILIVVVLLAWLIGRLLVTRIIARIVDRSSNQIDNLIFDSGVLQRARRLIPAALLYWMLPELFTEPMWLIEAVRRVVAVYAIFQLALMVNTVLDVLHGLYARREQARKRPIKAYIQIVKIAVLIVAGVLAVTTLFNRSPLAVLGGIGAVSAVLILVFKDTLLGLVASIQLNTNQMVSIDDWIEMPKYGANGAVIDIGLQIVRVQNWNKTIVSIPSYALVSEAFVNWRGMDESGGRRIKRAIHIDISSVKFCDAESLQRYERYALISEYVRRKRQEVGEYNRTMKHAEDDRINGRRLTNLGTFRAYIDAYLRAHPQISDTLTCMVRQLPPGMHGIPIEVYAFCTDQRWEHYEAIQADIFDHLLAIAPDFDLRIYQILSDETPVIKV